LVELKDAEEAISSLTTDLEELRNKTKKIEMAASKRIKELHILRIKRGSVSRCQQNTKGEEYLSGNLRLCNIIAINF
jgi:hypothetical protein